MPFGAHEMGCGSAKVAQSSSQHGDSRGERGREDTGNSRHGYSRNSSCYYTGSAGTSRQSNKGGLFKQSVSENDFSTVTSISGTSRIRVTLSSDGSLLEVETEKLDEGAVYRGSPGSPRVDYDEGGHGGGAQGHAAFGREHSLRGAEGGSAGLTTAIDVTRGSLRPYSNSGGNRQTIHASLPNLRYGCNGANTLYSGSSCTCSCPDSGDSNGKEEINTIPHSTGQQEACPGGPNHSQHPPRHHYYHTIRPYCQGPSCTHQHGHRHTVCRHKTDVSSASPAVESSTEEATSAEATSGTFNSQRTSSRKAKQSIVSVISSNNSSCQATQALCVCCSGVSQSPLGPSALTKTYDTSIGASLETVLSDKARSSKANHVDAKINSHSHVASHCNKRCHCQAISPHKIHGDRQCNYKCHVRHYHVITTSGATYGSSPDSVSSLQSPLDFKYQPLSDSEDKGPMPMVEGSGNSCRANGDKCPPTPTHHSCYKNTTATYYGYGTKRYHYGDSDTSQAHERLLEQNGEDFGINQNQDQQGNSQLGYYHHSNGAAAPNHKGEGSEDFTSKFQACHNESSCSSCTCCQCTSHCPSCVLIDVQNPNSGENQGHFHHKSMFIESKSLNLRDSHQRQCHQSCNHNNHCSAIAPLAEAGIVYESESCADDRQSPCSDIGMKKRFAYHDPKTCISCSQSLNKVNCQPEEDYSNSSDLGQYDILLPNNSNNTFINNTHNNVPDSIQTNTIIVKPEIHNYDSSGFSPISSVDEKSHDTMSADVANISPLPSYRYKPSITTSMSAHSFPYHDHSPKDKILPKDGSHHGNKIVRSQSYTMSTLKEERLLAQNDIIVEAQIEKPPRGLLGGNKRSISAHSGSSKGSKSSLQNGIANGVSGLSNNPPTKGGSKFRNRAPILKKGSKSESMGSSTDSSILGNGEGAISTNSSTVDSGLGAEVPIDGMLDLDILYLTVHQDFFNGKYT